MTTIDGHDYDGCIICAVRAMTEGKPDVWAPKIGDQICGVAVRQGTVPSDFAPDGIPTLDLWTGSRRIRVYGMGTLPTSLGGRIAAAEIQIGDTVTITRNPDLSWRVGKAGHWDVSNQVPRMIKDFTVDVVRGHHR